MNKNLVICPSCHSNGTQSVLGELGTDNNFWILRFHKHYTKIVGKDFGVICGNCGENVYIRKEEHGETNSRGFVGRNMVRSWYNVKTYATTAGSVGTWSPEGTS